MVNNLKYQIYRLKSENYNKVVNFLNLNLPDADKIKKFWQWRKKGIPESGGLEAVVAQTDGGTILGCIAIVKANTCCGSETLKMSWQQDSIVSKHARGMGIGKRLVKEGLAGWDMVIAKGTSKAMYGLRKSLGFKDVSNSTYLIKILQPDLIKGGIPKKIIAHGAYYWSLLTDTLKKKSTIEVRSIEHFETSFNDLAEKTKMDATIGLVKDQAYLNWRYQCCPDMNYKIFRAGNKFARGAIVLSIKGVDKDEGWIVDLICHEDDMECMDALMNECVSYFKNNKASRIWSFVTHPFFRRRHYRFGFIPTTFSPKFTYLMRQGSENKFDNNLKWNFWHGDGDMELYQ